ncbi:glycosyltransferase [Streptomyces sp. NPDC093261]|uniref:glycosyltransferase n=1 Tax=Streptomyces sp. NPDC093261 TaxID=3366037 RepID=UPI0037F3DBE3
MPFRCCGRAPLGLESFLRQTRRPDSVHVVDDGSTSTDYAAVRDWWYVQAERAGIETTWQRVPNGGKRHAQAHGIRVSPQADIYITVDSDSCLAPNAVEQIMVPSARGKVRSVAGIVLATNNRGPQRPRLRRDDGTRLSWPARVGKLTHWRGRQGFARVTRYRRPCVQPMRKGTTSMAPVGMLWWQSGSTSSSHSVTIWPSTISYQRSRCSQ